MGEIKQFPTQKIKQFPTQKITAEEVAEITSWFTATTFTRHELLHEPPSVIAGMGPWVAEPGTELDEVLKRMSAIVTALIGPGRVPLRGGLEIVRDLAEHLLMGVTDV